MTKTEKIDTNLHGDSGQVYIPPKLDDKGRELVSSVSLVSRADMRPITLGERIRRYMRTPQFQRDLDSEDGWDPEDLEEIGIEEENPISIHEDRAKEIAGRVRTRKTKEADELKQKEIEAENAEKEKFRKRFKELQEEGSVPEAPRPEKPNPANKK